MLTEDKILDISQNYYSYLMSLQNVVGVGLGYKYINRIDTLEPCIHILVKRKISKEYISSNNLIPKTYMGIKTDVIETGKFRIYDGKGHVFPHRIRPLQGGFSISPDIKKGGNGTLGCIVTKRTKYDEFFYILSNSHVLAARDSQKGMPILQPGKSNYGDSKYDKVAYLENFNTVESFYETQLSDKSFKVPINCMDCAIAKISNRDFISNKIFVFGKIEGVSQPKINLPIKKVGMSAGISYGTIRTLGLTTIVDWDKDMFGNQKVAYFKNQIAANLYSKGGDSGSVVLNYDNQVVGLLFGGDGDYSLFTDIKVVLDALNVSIFTGY